MHMRNNHPKQQLHTISKVETISESNAIRQAFLTIQIVTTKKRNQLYYNYILVQIIETTYLF